MYNRFDRFYNAFVLTIFMIPVIMFITCYFCLYRYAESKQKDPANVYAQIYKEEYLKKTNNTMPIYKKRSDRNWISGEMQYTLYYGITIPYNGQTLKIAYSVPVSEATYNLAAINDSWDILNQKVIKENK